METSVLIAFGGLAVAALTVYLSFRERRHWYREQLHERQFDACAELNASAQAVAGHYGGVAVRGNLSELHGKPFPKDLWKEADSEYVDFAEVGRRVSLVLPSSAIRAFENFRDTLDQMRSPSNYLSPELDPGGPDLSTEATRRMFESMYRLIAALRDVIGVDQLSAETQALIGRHERVTGASQDQSGLRKPW